MPWDMRAHLAACRPGQNCAAALSGLPLLNFTQERRVALVPDVMAALAPARGSFIQFSCGLKAPAAAPPGIAVSRSKWLFMNIPPARVWIYTHERAAVTA